MKQTLCDSCTKRVWRGHAIHITSTRYAESADLDFCSWRCVKKYAKRKTEVIL